MSLSDMSKEQKQYLLLGALATAILAILVVLGIRFSLSSITVAKSDLKELQEKIEGANRSLARRDTTSRDFGQTVSVLRRYVESAPPERNYYSWATEIIYATAGTAGLEIDSIEEINLPKRESAAQADLQLESYSLRITAHGGYEGVKCFLVGIEENHPLARVTGIEISTGRTPYAHDIQLFVQWPFNLGEMAKLWDDVARKQVEVARHEASLPIAPVRPEAPSPEPVRPQEAKATPATTPMPLAKQEPAVVARPAPLAPAAPAEPPSRPEPKVAAKPMPAPKPVEAAQPATAVVPKPGPLPPVVAPAPVVAMPEPPVEPVAESLPKPVVAEKPRPVPPVEPVPVPAPVIVVAPAPTQRPEPAEAPAPRPQPIAVVKPAPADPLPEPAPTVAPPPAPVVEPAAQTPPIEAVAVLPKDAGIEVPAMVADAADGEISEEDPIVDSPIYYPPYVAPQDNGSRILKEMLKMNQTKSPASLGSFLDGLVGDMHEKK